MPCSNPVPDIAHPKVMDLPAADASLRNRPIRSFALRGGHMSEAQKRAYRDGIDLWSVNYEHKIFNQEGVFDNQQPLIFEIGFGMGETTASIAQTLPHLNFLGAEVYTSGVGSLLKHIAVNQIKNIRVIQHDAVEVLSDMFEQNSLAGIHIYFPDPWHKARHNKRRLIQAPFIKLASSRIKPDGYIHCATDWAPYAEQMLAVLSGESSLINTAKDYSTKPQYRPLTKFENRGIKLGHGVWDLVFKKI